MLEGLVSAVDELIGVGVGTMTDAAIHGELIALRREIDRQEHRAAALLVAVHQRGIPCAAGASSTPAWVQWQTGQRWRDAKLSLDAGLACAVLPLVAKAWAQGEISASAAAAIGAGRDDAHGDVYGEMEQTLVEYAAANEWRSLHAVVRHYRRYVDALDEREPSDRNGLHLSNTLGRWAQVGDYDDLGGHVISTAISAAMGKPLEGDERTPAKRRADALVDVARFYLDHADLPLEAGEAPHVSVVVDWTTLTGGAQQPTVFGPTLSPVQLRQLLCDCNVSRIVTGPDSRPLDVGREQRTAPTWMRKALAKRDGGCRYPGCERPPNRCQAHHVWEWEDGGPTAIHNLVLLCSFHHHTIHRPGWTTTFDGHTLTITNPDGQPISTVAPHPNTDPPRST